MKPANDGAPVPKRRNVALFDAVAPGLRHALHGAVALEGEGSDVGLIVTALLMAVSKGNTAAIRRLSAAALGPARRRRPVKQKRRSD